MDVQSSNFIFKLHLQGQLHLRIDLRLQFQLHGQLTFIFKFRLTLIFFLGLLVRASCVRHTLLSYHCFHTCSSSSSFFLLSFFRSPFSAASYIKLKKTKIVGISLSDQKKPRKTLGVIPGTLYTPQFALIWG